MSITTSWLSHGRVTFSSSRFVMIRWRKLSYHSWYYCIDYALLYCACFYGTLTEFYHPATDDGLSFSRKVDYARKASENCFSPGSGHISLSKKIITLKEHVKADRYILLSAHRRVIRVHYIIVWDPIYVRRIETEVKFNIRLPLVVVRFSTENPQAKL